MDPSEARARAFSTKSAARGTPPRRRTRLILVLAGLGALLLLVWGTVALRRADSTLARQRADGVLLAQRRMGEAPLPGGPAVTPPRSPTSSLPATPTLLPMPGPQPTAEPKPPTGPRYVIRDSAPPRPAPGHLFVDTQPESQVWIDGEAKGKTPLDVLVGPGNKALRLEAAGFHPLRETFEAGQGTVIRRALVPLGSPKK